MAMGKRKSEQAPLWIPTTELPMSPGHPFYVRLNEILEAAGFDRFVEEQCRSFYAPVMGRPSLAPGRYFRLLLIGYFEGLDSERGIAWRATDSLAVRQFLGLGLDEAAPDHSTISRTRRLIDVEAHQAVFTWVQERLVEAHLLRGKTLAVDATTLEANAAMRSIVRRDTGESYQKFLTRLATASGLKTPSREALSRLDRRRKKRTSNAEWVNPSDSDAKVTQMKDGRIHLAHKVEHAVDLETGALVAVTLHGADVGDTTSLLATTLTAAEQLATVQATVPTALVGDRGYHSNDTLLTLRALGIRAYLAEPDRGRRCWAKEPEAQQPVYGNRRRVGSLRGKRLMRRRGEYVERTFAHVYDTGGLRRIHLRGHPNILKRLIVHAGAFNLGLLMRHVFGRGTPRGLQGRRQAWRLLWLTLCSLLAALRRILTNRPGLSRSLAATGSPQ
jgi:transposase